MNQDEIARLKQIFDTQYQKNATKSFINTDPIQIPYLYYDKNHNTKVTDIKFMDSEIMNIEIMGFIASMMAFGSRKQFIPKLHQIAKAIDDIKLSPSSFIYNFETHKRSINDFTNEFVYRHFSSSNLLDYFNFLHHMYVKHGGFYPVVLSEYQKHGDIKFAISKLRQIFIQSAPKDRTSINHFGNIDNGGACKKINMFLRWMVRKDDVDFGIWDRIPKSALYIPLDVHVLKNSINLKIIDRKTADFKSALQITEFLRQLDPNDPIKYDFALFGLTAL